MTVLGLFAEVANGEIDLSDLNGSMPTLQSE